MMVYVRPALWGRPALRHQQLVSPLEGGIYRKRNGHEEGPPVHHKADQNQTRHFPRTQTNARRNSQYVEHFPKMDSSECYIKCRQLANKMILLREYTVGAVFPVDTDTRVCCASSKSGLVHVLHQKRSFVCLPPNHTERGDIVDVYRAGRHL
jgi:hypothetical protein